VTTTAARPDARALLDTHRQTLDGALQAVASRAFHAGYPEIPSGKIYGETARDDGLAAFQARIGQPFAIDQPGAADAERIGVEVSPYGLELNTSYPAPDLDRLLPAAGQAMKAWGDADVETRTGVCLEILHRLNQRSFELAFAVMHTTGQGFMMAFQAGGPHAQDRGLEAVAYAWLAQTQVPDETTWSKKVSRTDVVTLHKRYRRVPRGVGVLIGCSTFPTWNGYPGLFASLATGNAVVVKPHPGAVMPLAITVEIARNVLAEHGFDPNVVTLAVDTPDAPTAQSLVERPEVAIVDYTGGSDFGRWIEQHANGRAVFTEKAGVNSMVLDSIEDLETVTGNLAFSLSLYSGQMCTTPQNVFIPRGGITVSGETLSFDETAAALVKAIDWLLGDQARGTEILGAVQNDRTLERVEAARAEGGEVLREPAALEHPTFPGARVRSPAVVKVDASDEVLYMREVFGPLVYVVATDSTEHSIELASRIAREHGAITFGIHSTDAAVLDRAEDAMVHAGVPVSCNLTGQIFVNQSAAFSDFHVSGANPAGNATLCDLAFVSPRFRIVQRRDPVASSGAGEG